VALSRRVLKKGSSAAAEGTARRMFFYTHSSIVDNFSPLV